MFWLPIIAGATIGALTNKDPIKGAIIGGTLGAAGGATLGAGAGAAGGAGGAGAAGGGLLGSTAGAGLNATAGASGLIGAQSVAAPTIGASTAGIGASNIGASVIPGSIESEGLMKTIGDGSTLYNQDYFANVLGNPIYTGGEGLLSNVAGDIGANLGNLTPQNLMGVASLLGDQQDTSQYRQMAGTGGGVKQGSGQGLAVQMPQAKVFKRRKA